MSKKTAKLPKIFVFSGPGGVGKTTLVKELFRKKSVQQRFLRGISYTTRPIRPKEVDSKDYTFVTSEEFLHLRKKDFFLETEKVVKYYYGTPYRRYTEAKKQKKDLILCIDVKGGMYLKKKRNLGRIITIFISVPDDKELLKRLKKRVESKEVIKNRIALAKKEVNAGRKYDYLVINRKIKETVAGLEAILTAEQFKNII